MVRYNRLRFQLRRSLTTNGIKIRSPCRARHSLCDGWEYCEAYAEKCIEACPAVPGVVLTKPGSFVEGGTNINF